MKKYTHDVEEAFHKQIDSYARKNDLKTAQVYRQIERIGAVKLGIIEDK